MERETKTKKEKNAPLSLSLNAIVLPHFFFLHLFAGELPLLLFSVRPLFSPPPFLLFCHHASVPGRDPGHRAGARHWPRAAPLLAREGQRHRLEDDEEIELEEQEGRRRRDLALFFLGGRVRRGRARQPLRALPAAEPDKVHPQHGQDQGVGPRMRVHGEFSNCALRVFFSLSVLDAERRK